MNLLKKLIVLSVPLIILMSSCQKKEKEEVTLLLDWFANPNHISLFYGIENKIFEKHGIYLKILNLQEPPSSLPYLLSGQVDVSLYYFPSSLLGFQKNPSFKVIAKLVDEPLHAFIFREDLNINTIEDFSGKHIGTYGDQLSNRCIESFLEKGVKFSSIKHAHFDLNALLYTRMIDVNAGFWNIEPFQLEEKNIRLKTWDWKDLEIPCYPELVFICKDKFLQDHPDFADKFRCALQESIDQSKLFHEEAFASYLELHPEKKATVEWEKKAWMATTNVLAKSQVFDVNSLEKFCYWFNKNKILSSEFIIEKLLETQ